MCIKYDHEFSFYYSSVIFIYPIIHQYYIFIDLFIWTHGFNWDIDLITNYFSLITLTETELFSVVWLSCVGFTYSLFGGQVAYRFFYLDNIVAPTIWHICLTHLRAGVQVVSEYGCKLMGHACLQHAYLLANWALRWRYQLFTSNQVNEISHCHIFSDTWHH